MIVTRLMEGRRTVLPNEVAGHLLEAIHTVELDHHHHNDEVVRLHLMAVFL